MMFLLGWASGGVVCGVLVHWGLDLVAGSMCVVASVVALAIQQRYPPPESHPSGE